MKWIHIMEFHDSEREPQAIEVRDADGTKLFCISVLPHSVMIDPEKGSTYTEDVVDRPDSLTVRFR